MTTSVMKTLHCLSIPVLLLSVSLLPGAPGVAAGHGQESSCPVFVLQVPEDGAPSLERRSVPGGSQKVFSRSPGEPLVGVILPVGPGSSGSLETRGDGTMIVLRCEDRSLHPAIRSPSGETRTRPARPLAELRDLDIRVSVRGGDGSRGAFVIRGWETAVPDTVGPVKDPFGDLVPLTGDDFVVHTETDTRWTGETAHGETALTFDGHLRVLVQLAGVDSEMYLDLAAPSTLVGRSFLPDSVEVEEVDMVEYSEAGKRLLDYAPGGATGTVTGIEGLATLPTVEMGSITLHDVDVEVLNRLPDWFPEGVVGILGLDVLRRASVVSLSIPAGEDEPGRLVLSESGDPSSSKPAPGALRVPFALATHLFVQGVVRDRPVHFILDTGAPRSFLDTSAAEALEVPLSTDERRVRGLDDEGMDVVSAQADLELGGHTFDGVPFEVAPLAPFAVVRNGGQLAGLLGNTFLARFRRIDLDFREGVMWLVPRQ